MKTKILILAVATLFTASGAAEARRMDKRENRQGQRIHQGIKSGEVTKREAKKLIRGQKKVHAMENQAMADGDFSLEEKARIEHAQDKQSKKIFRAKHNERDRDGSNDADSSAGE